MKFHLLCFRKTEFNLAIAQMLMIFALFCDMCDVFIKAQAGLQTFDVFSSLVLGIILR